MWVIKKGFTINIKQLLKRMPIPLTENLKKTKNSSPSNCINNNKSVKKCKSIFFMSVANC